MAHTWDGTAEPNAQWPSAQHGAEKANDENCYDDRDECPQKYAP